MIYNIKAFLIFLRLKIKLHRMKYHLMLYSAVTKELRMAFYNAKTVHEKKAYSELINYWEGLIQ